MKRFCPEYHDTVALTAGLEPEFRASLYLPVCLAGNLLRKGTQQWGFTEKEFD